MNSYDRQFNHISAKSLEDHLPDNNVNTEQEFPQRLCRRFGKLAEHAECADSRQTIRAAAGGLNYCTPTYCRIQILN
jgi:hypothetical protein